MTEQQTRPEAVNLDSSDGYVQIGIDGQVQELDLYRTFNRLVELHREHESHDQADESKFNQAVIDFVAELGWPKVNERTANAS